MWREGRTESMIVVVLFLIQTAFSGILVPHKHISYGIIAPES